MVPLLCIVGGGHSCQRAGAAYTRDAAASDRAASLAEYGRLRAHGAERLERNCRPIE
jgi:hypothetical protein